MRFNSLDLEKFKRFERASLEFGDITILTGANSSGKSTILKAISTILQSCEHANFPFAIDLNGEFCELGAYKDVCYGLKAKENVRIGAEVQHKKSKFYISGKYRYASNGNLVLPKEIEFRSPLHSLEVRWEGKSAGYKARGQLNRESEKAAKSFENTMRVAFSSIFELSNRVDIDDLYNKDPEFNDSERTEEEERKRIEEILKRMRGSESWENLKAKKPDELIDELSSDPAFSSALSEIKKLNDDISSNCNYVAPIRAHPKRQYYVNSFEPKADSVGENSHQILQYWKSNRKDKFIKLNAAANMLQLASEVGVKNIKGNLIENSIRPYQHKKSINIADVGFGLSQAIPMLVSDIQLEKDSCLLINQPEVHLHPSSQALLANYFASNIDERQYIIETHSEYIINRMRLLATKGTIDPKRVKIYFFDSMNEGSIYKIEIGTDGSLKGAPEQFFRTYKEDSFELAMSGFDDD